MKQIKPNQCQVGDWIEFKFQDDYMFSLILKVDKTGKSERPITFTELVFRSSKAPPSKISICEYHYWPDHEDTISIDQKSSTFWSKRNVED